MPKYAFLGIAFSPRGSISFRVDMACLFLRLLVLTIDWSHFNVLWTNKQKTKMLRKLDFEFLYYSALFFPSNFSDYMEKFFKPRINDPWLKQLVNLKNTR